jgi:hypothetical protein
MTPNRPARPSAPSTAALAATAARPAPSQPHPHWRRLWLVVRRHRRGAAGGPGADGFVCARRWKYIAESQLCVSLPHLSSPHAPLNTLRLLFRNISQTHTYAHHAPPADTRLPVEREEKALQLAATVEGHVDNLAPCIYGGMQVRARAQAALQARAMEMGGQHRHLGKLAAHRAHSNGTATSLFILPAPRRLACTQGRAGTRPPWGCRRGCSASCLCPRCARRPRRAAPSS